MKLTHHNDPVTQNSTWTFIVEPAEVKDLPRLSGSMAQVLVDIRSGTISAILQGLAELAYVIEAEQARKEFSQAMENVRATMTEEVGETYDLREELCTCSQDVDYNPECPIHRGDFRGPL